jgi:hypothetical protein
MLMAKPTRRFWTLVAIAMAGLFAGGATVSAREPATRAAVAAHRHRAPRHKRSHGKHAGHRKRAGHRCTAHHPRAHHRRAHQLCKRRRHRHPAHPGKPTTGAPPVATTTPPSSTSAAGPCPSGPPGSTDSVGGSVFALEGMDTFAKDAPSGSFAQSTNNQIVYTGDHGMSWTGYPDGTPSTHSGSAEGYQPSTVLSVHGGVLDFYLHNDSNGNPVGADPSPLPGGNRYQTYGMWSFCEQVAPADAHRLDDFHQAPLLWPQSDSDSRSAESDFPEADLNALDFSGFAHYGGSGSQDVFNVQSAEPSYDPTQWHVYTQTWGPNFRSYYVDGLLIGTSTNQVWSAPERWQLQLEPLGTNDGDSGHVFVKWIWIGTLS